MNVESGERQQAVGRQRAQAVLILVVAFALAELTPVYVAYAAPQLRNAVLGPIILGSQAIPYVVCGLLWLPWKSAGAVAAARVVSIVVLAITVAFCIPSWYAPGANDAKVVALGYLMGALALTSVVLTGSLVAFVVLKFRGRRHQTPPGF